MDDADPMAGPNSPTEPPKPTVSGAVIRGKYIWRLLSIPFRLDKEYKMVGMACSPGVLDMYLTNKYTRNNPIKGRIKYSW